METLVSNRIYCTEPTQEIIEYCERELVVTNPTYEQMMRLGKENLIRIKHIPPRLKLYVVSGNQIIMPFGVLYAIWPMIKNYPVRTKFNDAGQISCINDTISQPLYDYQETAVKTMVATKGGVLVGGTGSGKTNCGCEIAKRIGRKFLWLTHTHDLVKQSYDRIKSLYPNMKLEITSEGQINIGEDGTIATVQTMANLDPALYRDKFDTVITDECHHIVNSPTLSKLFARVISNIPARYKFGLTATPKRNDSMTKTIYTTVGCNPNGVFCPTYEIKKSETKTLTAEHVKYDLPTPFKYECLNGDGTFSYAGLIDALAEDEERNEEIIKNIIELNKEGRKQIALCLRVSHCEKLYEMAIERGLKAKILTGKIVSKKKRAEVLDHPEDWDLLVATFSLAKEGLDVPMLDTIHWCSIVGNKIDAVQSAGRVERAYDNKKEPLVIDYVDIKIPYCVSRYKKRVGWLKKRED